MRFWMGHLQQIKEKHLLRYPRLCLPWDPRRLVLRQFCRYLGHRSPGLRDADRKGTLLPHQPKVDHEKHHECTSALTQCDFSFPAEMSTNARMFITKALQKNPGKRFTIENLLHDKFVAQNRQYSWWPDWILLLFLVFIICMHYFYPQKEIIWDKIFSFPEDMVTLNQFPWNYGYF